jgi:hypothetical protein
MRTIVRGSTKERCEQSVNVLKKKGWTQISEVKVDPTPTIDISWVAVMERKDNEGSNKKRKWNSYVSYQ